MKNVSQNATKNFTQTLDAHMNNFLSQISIQDITSIINTIVVIIALLYAYRQYKISQKIKTDETLLKTYEFIQKEEFIAARRVVLKRLSEIEFKDWTRKDEKYAEKVCRDYDTAHLMNDQFDFKENCKIIAIKWNYSIIKSYTITQPLIEKYRNERGAGFWKNFEKLYLLAKELDTDDTDNLLKI